jgi:DNA-binding response OmpR family regulator
MGQIIVASAIERHIDGLSAGVDDYLAEQFSPGELMARVRAIIRRIRSLSETRIRIALHDRAIDLSSRKIQGPGNPKEVLVPDGEIPADVMEAEWSE